MPPRTAKIACSIDARLLASVERLRIRSGESRSAVIARALAELVRAQELQQRVKAYVQSYLDHPESPADLKNARRTARQALAQLPWDDS